MRLKEKKKKKLLLAEGPARDCHKRTCRLRGGCGLLQRGRRGEVEMEIERSGKEAGRGIS